MNILCLSISDLQRFRLAYSVKDLSALFEEKQNDVYYVLKELGVRPPTEYVKEMSRDELARELAYEGHNRVSRKYNVSIPFLKSLFKPTFKDIPEEEKLRKALERYRSPEVVSRLYGVTKNQLPYVEHEEKLSHLGETKVAIGRRAELFVSNLLDAEDINKKDSRALWDLECPKYGRVNVKTKDSTFYKGWKFYGADNCDYIAAVLRTGKEYKAVLMIKADCLPAYIRDLNKLPEGAELIYGSPQDSLIL